MELLGCDVLVQSLISKLELRAVLFQVEWSGLVPSLRCRSLVLNGGEVYEGLVSWCGSKWVVRLCRCSLATVNCGVLLSFVGESFLGTHCRMLSSVSPSL